MMKEKINLKVLKHIMINNVCFYLSAVRSDSDSLLFDAYMFRDSDAVDRAIEKFFDMFDDESIKDIMKNINKALTASKHLLTHSKQDIIWFQHSLSSLKYVRGSIRS